MDTDGLSLATDDGAAEADGIIVTDGSTSRLLPVTKGCPVVSADGEALGLIVGSDDMLGLCEGWLLGMPLRLGDSDGTEDGLPEPLGTMLGCDDGIPLALGLCDGTDEGLPDKLGAPLVCDDGIPLALGLCEGVDDGMPELVGNALGCELGEPETLGFPEGTDDGDTDVDGDSDGIDVGQSDTEGFIDGYRKTNTASFSRIMRQKQMNVACFFRLDGKRIDVPAKLDCQIVKAAPRSKGTRMERSYCRY